MMSWLFLSFSSGPRLFLRVHNFFGTRGLKFIRPKGTLGSWGDERLVREELNTRAWLSRNYHIFVKKMSFLQENAFVNVTLHTVLASWHAQHEYKLLSKSEKRNLRADCARFQIFCRPSPKSAPSLKPFRGFISTFRKPKNPSKYALSSKTQFLALQGKTKTKA